MLYNNMGLALQEEGRLHEALAWYQRGLQVEPRLARLHASLGSLRAEQQKYAEAVACYETSLRLDPHSAEAHTGLGWVRHEQGCYEQAEECYRTALRLAPDLAPALCNLGTAHTERSDFAEAERCFRAAVEHDPRHAGAWSQLAFLLRGRLPDADRTALDRLLADHDLSDGKRVALHFGLAQVLDAQQRYEEATEHLRRAHALARAQARQRGEDYDPAGHFAFVDRLIATFTPAFFERTRAFGVDSERPIFIVGLPRSGTTLTEQILARHSHVFGAGELRLARECFELLAGESGDEDRAFANLARLDAATVRRLAGRHLDSLATLNATAPRVADKMPDNYLYAGLLAVLFPRARFIHCRRDLRDVAVSCWMTHFRDIRWTNDPEHVAARFHEYERLTAHWRQVLPLPVLEVEYEETVRDLEGVARRLVAWCSLDWEPACSAPHQGTSPVRTASVCQVRQPVYTDSVGRWKKYEQALGALFSRLPQQA
jgi:tetratricopeptide (TPR) repeat protein